MARSKNRGNQEVNAGSMADIAFLLLIFFLVTTQINSDKGLQIKLPPPIDPTQPPPDIKMKDRNIFKILINSNDMLLVEDEPLTDPYLLRDMVHEFITNNGKDKTMSDSPQDAVVSIKADRGTSYELFIQVLDNAQGAYYKARGEVLGINAEQYLGLDPKKPEQDKMLDRAKEAYPMRISIAEPNKIGG
ncbi:ExbD/TolR family protein [Marinigracilibium pacificum]|uniref:Biopolymer transporter ExbD n=1 Tax=Marinigracilibium pacificum TaxID=2729599 RepID=A0A848J895_9BACT|nr:biopolymer transporter ExbD [Marinigracilibium pacificum]NMM50710.1 biopolymer transporter ExbD [Marinigracilibium pacificum]